MWRISKKSFLFVIASFLFLALIGCASSEAQESEPLTTGLDANEWNNLAFKDKFPLHWESYLENMENQNEVLPKNDPSIEPYLPIVWNGFGFAVEYNLTRGHTYAFEDQMNVRRITQNPNAVSACMSCKTTLFPEMIEEFGAEEAYKLNYHEEALPWLEEKAGEDKGKVIDGKGHSAEWGHVSVGCSTCHDPETMELRITAPHLTDGLERLGFDIENATQHDMRSLVCAQCHVEYYFDPLNDLQTTLPWGDGLTFEEQWDYSEAQAERDGGFQGEFVSAISGGPILKAQHPEYELWSYGPHQTVSCADCHMPYQRVDGEKMSSHRWGSPMETLEESCRTCHGDKTPSYLENRVDDIQKRHKEQLLRAQDISASAHYYVNRMITSGVDEEKVKEAQALVREGQWFWDMPAAENSYGFHNPDGAMASFTRSIDKSQEAIILATRELMAVGEDIDELEEQIKLTKENVIDESVNHEKHLQAINEWFPDVRDN
ncbi:ammonia-forming cytochrome c nitrite reductase subunit c552 [Salipaludibacillus sp. CUR1]|uniref:ammonia-forming cytochrome c nitrite reductase subunit c552 n=1 Tax=Salipaludibacillus sp. CUR1 TaxID=2820003 RepID=UPI001E58D918|nr:ammonia-forming cytochrome c nitrite reductase subunit c552 [Salipaludibacillus sp. CUR1]MCE7792075.1 ammonia-forming cytochrome c nitrite reductase subunit c552 [Salipaludibacillus sp. CUR1]